ncbi:MAG: GNAT family N-acetyltransferase [Alphaproteobacteria bacterium]|nr:GNAT family N-acetyltransferase [Alphaproteobacteria bacterium]
MATIRDYRKEDLEDVYRICLETGDAGRDASSIYRDRQLLGHIYAGPYVVLEPECALVLEDELGVGGYVIGALDTHAFEKRLEAEWWPALRGRYSDPMIAESGARGAETRMAHLIHHPTRTPRRIAEPYPSHLHIDLLPRLQKRGFGTRMIDAWLERVRKQGSTGMHLGVGAANERAIRFYRAYGLAEIERLGPPYDVLYFGTKL